MGGYLFVKLTTPGRLTPRQPRIAAANYFGYDKGNMHPLIELLLQMPVTVFVLVGAFVQEIISPLPSFVVFVPAGASLQAQSQSLLSVLGLALAAAVGRVLAGVLLYWLSGALRNFLYTKKGRWFGISKHDISKLSAKFNSQRSWWTIFWLWAIPVVPGMLISLTAGFMRVALVPFITATYVGSAINALTYLLIGYFGLKAVVAMNGIELTGLIISLGAVVACALWLRRKGRRQRA